MNEGRSRHSSSSTSSQAPPPRRHRGETDKGRNHAGKKKRRKNEKIQHKLNNRKRHTTKKKYFCPIGPWVQPIEKNATPAAFADYVRKRSGRFNVKPGLGWWSAAPIYIYIYFEVLYISRFRHTVTWAIVSTALKSSTATAKTCGRGTRNKKRFPTYVWRRFDLGADTKPWTAIFPKNLL